MRRGLRVQILSPRPVDVFLTGRDRPRHVIGVSLFISMLHFAGLLDPHVPERTRRALCRRNAPRSPRVASLDVSAEATVVLNRTYSEKARLIERLLGGNRRAALDVLSEIRPKNASIINRVRAWKQLVIDLVRRLSTQLNQPPTAWMQIASRKSVLSQSISERRPHALELSAHLSRMSLTRID
jgi:hypothetical protein